MSIRTGFLSIICLILCVISCKKKSKIDHVDEVQTTYSELIKGYTSGVVVNNQVVEVHFVNLPDLQHVDANKLISFNPQMTGEASWSGRTLLFHPDKNWNSGGRYIAEVDLSKIPQANDDSRFNFSFDVLPKSFTLKNIQFINENEQNLGRHILTGEVEFSEKIDVGKVEKALVVKKGRTAYDIEWQHHIGQNTHLFRVTGIEREVKAYDINLIFDGESLNISKTHSETVRVPASGTFQYLSHNVNNGKDQSITINFSDILDESQEVDGLIKFDKNIPVKTLIQGNQIKIFTQQRQIGDFDLTIFNHLENVQGQQLDETTQKNIKFFDEKPQVALIKEGAIIPRSEGLKFPFRAVNVRALRLRIVKIYDDNIAFFLQRNDINGQQEIKRAGRLIYNDIIHLKTETPVDFHMWNNYSVNLEHYVDVEPGAIYRLYLSIERPYSLYPCANDSLFEHIEHEKWNTRINESDENFFNYYGYGVERDWRQFRYEDRNNPCKPSYYMDEKATVSQNLFASDLGLIAKKGNNNRLHIVASDIISTVPKSNVDIKAYTFQHTLIGSGLTNSEGVATLELNGQPYLVVARKGADVGYVRFDNGSAESVSMFQVEGQKNNDQINAFIYGERGVWRPGDSIFLQCILQDRKKHLPADHPIIFEWYNPKNQRVLQHVRTVGQNHIHDFRLKTKKTDPTGNWLAKIKIGNNTFSKTIKIETVKPNRLKMDVDFGSEIITIKDAKIKGVFSSKWLHGAKANGLEADVKLKISSGKTTFEMYEGFQFDDATKNYRGSEKEIFKGKLNESGEAAITANVSVRNAPGMLNAQLTSRVYERGGEFSIDRKAINLSPYSAYVGVKMPIGTGWWGALKESDSRVTRIVLLDQDGKPIDGQVEIQIFGMSWHWWYESERGRNLANFMRSNNRKALKSVVIDVVNGEALMDLPDLKYYSQYILLATHGESGHSSSSTFRYYWRQVDSDDHESSKMLQFQLNKDIYSVNDKIEVQIPSNGEGHFIASLEQTDEVIEIKRIKAKKELTTISFNAARELIPNAYIYVAYIQPHAQTANDLPIRMYGVQPVFIEDETTHLYPTISTTDTWKPEEEVSVSVSERDGKEMEYTLAVVDEGLLSLTRFKTPDPWTAFHKKEALAVKTWDVYDEIMGAHSGEMAGLLAIGGDGSVLEVGGVKANRFPPVVKFLGPFKLEKGETAKHTFTLPNYVGQVRAMVVASSDRAYGHAEKLVDVKKPLMVLASLPRVLGPGERLNLPVTVFAMEPFVKNVNVNVSAGELLSIQNKTQRLNFTQTGDEVAYFPIDVDKKIGKETVDILVEGHGETASYKINIDIRPSNPPVHLSNTIALEPGESKTMNVKMPGMVGTNSWDLEAVNGLQFDLGEKGKRLLGYPHGCVEQTTSRAFPQLFVSNLMDLTVEQKEQIESNIKRGIDRLFSFQLRNGGLGYWPNSTEASPWGTTYAGHFMLEAKKLGYSLPSGFLSKWVAYQKSVANNWLPSDYGIDDHGYRWSHELMQAYRLYTLALAGHEQIGAMNRLRGQRDLSTQAIWRLALAYHIIGRTDVSQDMIATAETDIKAYDNYGRTFGSSERDQGMILETLVAMGDSERAFKVAENLANKWREARWYSTQSTAYVLLSMFKFLDEQNSSPLKFSYAVDGGSATSIDQEAYLFQRELPHALKSNHTVSVKNDSENRIFFRINTSGIPLQGEEEKENKNLTMRITYRNTAGEDIDVTKLKRGTDFVALVALKNPGLLGSYTEMALSQIFPSGWEIKNRRMDALQDNSAIGVADYTDIRDDRVYSYFDIQSGQTRTFKVELTATFPGKYYQPGVFCEAMYDNDIYALEPGKWVEVVD